MNFLSLYKSIWIKCWREKVDIRKIAILSCSIGANFDNESRGSLRVYNAIQSILYTSVYIQTKTTLQWSMKFYKWIISKCKSESDEKITALRMSILSNRSYYFYFLGWTILFVHTIYFLQYFLSSLRRRIVW